MDQPGWVVVILAATGRWVMHLFDCHISQVLATKCAIADQCPECTITQNTVDFIRVVFKWTDRSSLQNVLQFNYRYKTLGLARHLF